MDFEQEQKLVADIKRYITENLPLSKLSDEELSDDYIIPAAFDERVADAVAEAVAKTARETGVARI